MLLQTMCSIWHMLIIREEWKVIVVGTNKDEKGFIATHTRNCRGIEYITFSFTGKFRQFEKKDLDYVTSLFAVDKEDYAIIYGTNLFLSNYVIKNFDKGHYASCEVELYNWKQYNHYFLNPKYIVYQIGRLMTYMKIKNMISY